MLQAVRFIIQGGGGKMDATIRKNYVTMLIGMLGHDEVVILTDQICIVLSSLRATILVPIFSLLGCHTHGVCWLPWRDLCLSSRRRTCCTYAAVPPRFVDLFSSFCSCDVSHVEP